MNLNIRLFLAWFALLVFGALAAPAGNLDDPKKVVTEVTATDLRDMLQGKKIVFSEQKDLEDKTMFVLTLADYKVVLYQYGGEGDKGTSLALSGAWEVENEPDLEEINSWNYARRYTKVYKDDEGDLHLEADLDLEGGVTAGAIARWIAEFEKQVPQFIEAFDLK